MLTAQPALSPRVLKLAQQLELKPVLLDRFEDLLHLSDSTACFVRNADKAEAQLIEAVRRTGHEIMTEWGQSLSGTTAAEAAAVRGQWRHSKKKSDGTPRSATSKSMSSVLNCLPPAK